MRGLSYDASEANVSKMIEVEINRIKHAKMLNYIYKKNSYSLIKHEI